MLHAFLACRTYLTFKRRKKIFLLLILSFLPKKIFFVVFLEVKKEKKLNSRTSKNIKNETLLQKEMEFLLFLLLVRAALHIFRAFNEVRFLSERFFYWNLFGNRFRCKMLAGDGNSMRYLSQKIDKLWIWHLAQLISDSYFWKILLNLILIQSMLVLRHLSSSQPPIIFSKIKVSIFSYQISLQLYKKLIRFSHNFAW